MGQAYDREFLSTMKDVAKERNIPLQQGVYCSLGKNENERMQKQRNSDFSIFLLNW